MVKSINTPISATPQYTLKEAVIEAVNTLKSNGSFSAHDITAAVREAVNEGEYALPGLENPNPSANVKYLVNHEDVKSVLNLLENDGTLANAGLTNVDYSGAFRVYQFDTAPADDSTDTDPADSDSDSDSNSTVIDSDSPVAKRIAAYLDNHDGYATIRQIHSSLKINGLTSKDLVALVDNLGYTVEPDIEGAFSTYIVT